MSGTGSDRVTIVAARVKWLPMRTFLLAALVSVAAPALAADVGQPAPDFALQDLDGKNWKLSELKGKKVVVGAICSGRLRGTS